MPFEEVASTGHSATGTQESAVDLRLGDLMEKGSPKKATRQCVKYDQEAGVAGMKMQER
jgi:hypothetical protein